MVSGVGSAAANEAKGNCEDARVQQDVCDDFIPIAQSGGAAAVSASKVFNIIFLVVFLHIDVSSSWGSWSVHDCLSDYEVERAALPYSSPDFNWCCQLH